MQTDLWWQDVTVGMLENARKRLRGLVHLIEKRKRKPIYTDFQDEIGEGAEVAFDAFTPPDAFEKFRAKARHFLRQHQMLFKVRRIEHQHQHFGLGLAGLLPQDHPRGHRFVGAGRIKAVGAGQVDQFGRFSGRKRHPPRLALDRNTRIVRNFLPRPGQRVEQRAFAGVGIADQRDHGGAPGHATDSDSSSTANARAWTRRSATVIRPTSTAIGSRLRNTPR